MSRARKPRLPIIRIKTRTYLAPLIGFMDRATPKGVIVQNAGNSIRLPPIKRIPAVTLNCL